MMPDSRFRFVLNYEEGGENCVLHGDAHSESVLTDVGGDPLPNARNLNVESTFEYGSRVGFWEIMRILRERRVDATIFAVGMALERNPEAAAHIADSGFEVACHGQRWIDYQFIAEAVERADMQRNIEVITRLIGKPAGRLVHRPPRAQHAPARGRDRRLSVRQRRLQRRSAVLDVVTAARPHLVVPYSFDCNDSRLQRGGDFATGEDFFAYCRDAFDWMYRLGHRGQAADDDHRPARAHHRPSGSHRSLSAASRSHPAA